MVKKIKKRNPIARDLLTSGLYRPRVVQSKKVYNRKKLKNGKELIKNLSHFSLSHQSCPIKNSINSVSPSFSIYLPSR